MTKLAMMVWGGDGSMSVSYNVVVTASVAVPGAILPVCAYDKIHLRRVTAASGKLSTERSKEDMLANPVISSSVKNPASAKEYLNSHSLLPFNEDPSHHLLSKTILDLTFTSSEMGAVEQTLWLSAY